MLSGKKEGGFSAPAPLKDRAGRILRVGKYWDNDTKEWTGVAESKFKESLGIGATPVDWDEDGDLDLLLGSNEGNLFVRINEGTPKEPAFATESMQVMAGGAMLSVPTGELIPEVADWDGDGRFDVLCGSGEGGIFWYPNVGTEGAPEFAAAETLIAPKGTMGKTGGEEPSLSAPEWPGERTQACAVDFDADGDLDLLVGDYNSGAYVEGSQPEMHGWVWLFRRK